MYVCVMVHCQLLLHIMHAIKPVKVIFQLVIEKYSGRVVHQVSVVHISSSTYQARVVQASSQKTLMHWL